MQSVFSVVAGAGRDGDPVSYEEAWKTIGESASLLTFRVTQLMHKVIFSRRERSRSGKVCYMAIVKPYQLSYFFPVMIKLVQKIYCNHFSSKIAPVY